MKNLMTQISKSAIYLSPDLYVGEEVKDIWIGRQPVTNEDISKTESRLNVKLPKDVVEFYQISNGTAEILSHTFGGFDPIETIDWLKILQPETIAAYKGMGKAYENCLKNSIVISGANHVHQVLIIQPFGKHKVWRYWEFATYLPGENEFKGIKQYLERINDFLIEQIENKVETIPSIDYAPIKKALLEKDWLQVYNICNGTIFNNLQYPNYIPNNNLYALSLLASHYLNNQSQYITFLISLPQFAKNEHQLNTYLIDKYMACSEKKELFFEDLQELKRFVPHEDSNMLKVIEAQIMLHRKDLLRPENKIAKQDYQLHFLYEYGDADGYISLIESDPYIMKFCDLLKTAKVYLAKNNIDKSKKCIATFLADNTDEVGLEAFVDEQLHRIM